MPKIVLEFPDSSERKIPVSLKLFEPEQQIQGKLQNPEELYQAYKIWQEIYGSTIGSRIKFQVKQSPSEVRRVNLIPQTDQVKSCIKQWFADQEFQPIYMKLAAQLEQAAQRGQEVRVLIQTPPESFLRSLPWSAWEFVDRFGNAEIAISSSNYEAPQQAKIKGRLKILVVIGDSTGIKTDVDADLFKQLPGKPDIVFLKEPSLQEFTQNLWGRSWDILFFAGHSETKDHSGFMSLNQNEEISIDRLSPGIKSAVEKGLKLAIFNSCDGLGFIEGLDRNGVNIPQMIVMREPVPDRVAQEFLRYFLEAFSGKVLIDKPQEKNPKRRRWYAQVIERLTDGIRSIFSISQTSLSAQTLYGAVKTARHRLREHTEAEFLEASWLPVIYQNSAVTPPTWAELSRQPKRRSLSWRGSLALCLTIACLVIGLRGQGVMQPLELKAYDHLVRMRPVEGIDPRLLVVTVEQADIYDQIRRGESGQGSLSNETLYQLIQVLEKYNPIAIGFDIFRDFSSHEHPALEKRILNNQSPALIFPCSHTNQESGKTVAPPPGVDNSRISFIDVPKDSDNITRRYSFTGNYSHAKSKSEPSLCPSKESLALTLAYNYLGKFHYSDANVKKIEGYLERSQFGNGGGYQRGYQHGEVVEKDVGNHLLNYRPYTKIRDFVEVVSIRDLLAGRVAAEKIKDRIILVGRNDGSDFSGTPYVRTDSNPPHDANEIPGVYLHAQATSQLLSAVLDNRPEVWWLNRHLEWLWIGTWNLVAFVLARYGQRLTRLSHLELHITGLLLLSLLVYVVCYLAMKAALLWLPMIPVLISLSIFFSLHFFVVKSLKKET